MNKKMKLYEHLVGQLMNNMWIVEELMLETRYARIAY